MQASAGVQVLSTNEGFTVSREHVPGNAEHYYSIGKQHRLRNDFAEAEACYRQSLQLRPDYVEVWISLGVLLRNTGKPDEAEACQREALRLEPENFIATLNLGNTLFDQDRHEEALDLYRRAVAQNPASPEAHNNLARSLWRLRDISAGPHYLHALELRPDYFEAAQGLGRCLYETERYVEAAATLATACRLRPQDTDTRLNLANALLASDQLEQAREQYDYLLRTQADVAHALGGLASILTRKGQYTKPRALFEQALQTDPGDVWIQSNYAQLLLRAGEFVKGWEHYEFRRRSPQFKTALVRSYLSEPSWQGETLEDKSLLVISEQGLGDEIMFASIHPEIMREARHCIIECDIRLQALFRRSFPQASIVGIQKKGNEKTWFQTLETHLPMSPPFDTWAPLGTLAKFRRPALGAFPQHGGYLRADDAARARWAARLRELGPGLKIGISWRGGTATTHAGARSMSLQQLQPIIADRRCHIISLQYGDCRGEIDKFSAATGVPVHHWQEAIDDYDETAALVCELDLVISVCTALVHLSGALGRPVWVMAPHVAEWRYGREGPDMIWYPSVRMFRQPKSDAWTPVIAEAARALRRLPRGER